MTALGTDQMTTEQIRQRVAELGEWFHNLDLGGVKTAPDHFLGDYPSVKWQRFSAAIPEDLRGKSALDVGCNAGFYSIQMKRRGAERVVGIDSSETYLEQARFAAKVSGTEIEFRKLSVYRVAELQERFDLVLFMGVLYHLRHPLLALELLHEHGVADLLVAQSMLRGSDESMEVPRDFNFWQKEFFEDEKFPRIYFIEKRFSNDPTNWWIPKRALWQFADYTPALGICQWFHFDDHRLDDGVRWLRRLGVRYLRTGLSWSDTERSDYEPWFDRMMTALEPFELTLTFCFTPESKGINPHHTSAPRHLEEYADFCTRMVRRYAR